MQISVNPYLTTTALGSFNTTSDGLVQGEAYDDPAVRYQLAGGILAADEAIPMWGGVGISELVPPVGSPAPDSSLGTIVSRALTLVSQGTKQMTGFSVFNQNYAAINSPQSPVPLTPTGSLVNLYRFKSNARIAVAMAPSLVVAGQLITKNVSWDFNAQQLIPGQAAFNANALTDQTWANTGGGQVTFTTTSAHGVSVGSYFTISGSTPAGYNGDYLAIAGTTGSTLVAVKAVDPGASSVHGTLVAGGGYLPVTVLDFNVGNSMTVSYDTVTGFATWSRNGNAAVIQI